MSIDARLTKLMPALSARERAILVLRSLKDGTAEDPSWRRSMPQEQTKEFNRLIGLMNATNLYLPLYIAMVEGMAKQEWVRLHWWSNMVSFGSALWKLGGLVPVSKRTEAEKAMAEVYPLVEMPWDAQPHPHSWMNVADNLEAFMKESVAHLWDDVNAIDVVLAEVSAEFDGEDALRSVMRGALEKARYELSLMHEFLSGKEAVENTVPSEESMELARTYFDKGVDLYNRM